MIMIIIIIIIIIIINLVVIYISIFPHFHISLFAKSENFLNCCLVSSGPMMRVFLYFQKQKPMQQ